jgi:S-methylmethionine-dependent homocysteine/selenocysteine methylase
MKSLIMNLSQLPQLSDGLFLTDGGMETTLIFHDGIDLPHFAGCALLETAEGREALRRYYRTYAALARKYETGFILESPTWRANPDWAEKLGWNAEKLAAINREGIALMHEIREEFETPRSPMVVSGCLGPRGDGYVASAVMTPEEAAAYHAPQIRVLRDTGVDVISAFTLTTGDEGLGIANAAAALGVPCVLSFTLETDGRLPSGEALREVIGRIDSTAATAPVYYMINCAHPTHFADILPEGEPWLERIRGVRANSSCRSHEELNESPDLDEGNPAELGLQYRELRARLPKLTILGGCCGTDHRHLEAICESCVAAPV